MKIRKNRWLLAVLAVTVIAMLLSCAQTQTKAEDPMEEIAYSEEDLGLRHETLYDEDTTVPVQGKTTTKEPGESTRFDRSFENSPPLIPHDISGMLPLEVEDHICMGCHMPEEAIFSGATSTPSSHSHAEYCIPAAVRASISLPLFSSTNRTILFQFFALLYFIISRAKLSPFTTWATTLRLKIANTTNTINASTP